jgi:NAD(P)-dependent dehydrogenase (short-subunit alcohol dehydrogenase family)
MILVTGAASGIGAALCTILGDQAIGLDRVAPIGGLSCDLSDPSAIFAAAASIKGPLDGIAHVAGLPGTWDADTIIAVNTRAPAALTDALLSKLKDGASIVAVSSVTALRCDWTVAELDALLDFRERSVSGMDGARAYELSKAALNRWRERTAAALQPRGIRVTTVSPGPVETPILKDFESSIGADKLANAAKLVGRHGQPQDIAQVIAFLLSDGARWINGSDVKADGGYHAIRAVAGA